MAAARVVGASAVAATVAVARAAATTAVEVQEAAAMVAAAVAEYGRAAAQPKFCMPSSAKFLNSKLARGLSAQRAYATSLAETLKDEAQRFIDKHHKSKY